MSRKEGRSHIPREVSSASDSIDQISRLVFISSLQLALERTDARTATRADQDIISEATRRGISLKAARDMSHTATDINPEMSEKVTTKAVQRGTERSQGGRRMPQESREPIIVLSRPKSPGVPEKLPSNATFSPRLSGASFVARGSSREEPAPALLIPGAPSEVSAFAGPQMENELVIPEWLPVEAVIKKEKVYGRPNKRQGGKGARVRSIIKKAEARRVQVGN